MSNAEQPIAATDLLGDLDLKLPAGFELIAADPKLGPQILSSLARIEERLAEAIAQTDHLADVASRHLLSAGGKRVRPLLALLCAAVDGEINDDVIEAAVVVELTHLATLYHDDVMDDAPKRRGVDSAQMIWGNSVAILTGDLIFSRASLLVSELGTRPMKIQSQTFERLVLGQLFETTGPREGQDLLDHYIAVIEGKTGSLIAAAGEYGSLLSGASEDVISMVKAYGELVGVAFQLADDVIDIVSDGKTSGKTRGTDLLGDLDLKLPAGFELIAADPKLGPQILSSLARIEERLGEAIAQTDHLADVASRHLLLAGGKRVRPLLALLSAAVDGEINDEVIEAAVVVELTHLATLYHDDVMDDAPKRRGVDSAQMIWGNSVAILTGDLIFSRASLLVSELGTRPMKIQSQTFERLVLGQLFETTGRREGQDLLDHYIAVIEGKTGSLIAAAGEYGSLLSGASEEVISMVKTYGELVGVAFQLADDVIDIVSDGKTSGKTRGTDLREGVPTLPTILLDRAVAAGDESAREVRALLDADLSSDEALETAVEALSAHPVTQEAWQIAYDWADRAIEAIAPLPDSTAKAALESFAHAVVHREG